MKSVFVWFTFMFFALAVLPVAYAALEDSGAQLQGAIENVSNGVDKTRDVIDQQKYSFLGEQWKEFMLQNKFIGPVHQFFVKSDMVFVVLFGRHYDLSLTLFFAFLLWLFTLIWSSQAARAFFKNGWISFLIGLAFTVLIAQLQLFNKLSEAAFKVMFYQTSALWSFIILIFLIVALIVYFYLGRLIGKYMKQAQLAREARLQKLSISLLKEREKAKDKAVED